MLSTDVVVSGTVTGLTLNTLYHWRARLLYEPGKEAGAARWQVGARTVEGTERVRSPRVFSLQRVWQGRLVK